MTDRELLEEIKKNVLTSEFDLFGNAYISMPKGNFDWLIQQAELREEQVQRNLQALENINVLEGIYERLESENKRYREAKKQIEEKYEYFQDIPSSVSTGLSMAIEILDKALEGDEE